MKINIYYSFTALLVLLIFSCGEEKSIQLEDSTPIHVTVKTVTSQDLQPFLSLSGKVQAEQSADLSTRIMGFVEKVYVNIGDQVKQGQLLLTINSNDLQSKRAQAKANVIQANSVYNGARKDYDRYKNLFEKQSASQKEFDDIETRFETANAQLLAAKQMLNEVNAHFAYVNIKAPFDGVITSKMVKAGDMANPGMPLISLEKPEAYDVILMVPENDISDINLDQMVEVSIKSLDQTINGKVSEISTSAKNTDGQFLVKINLMKTEVPILSGMFVNVKFPVSGKEGLDRVLVPVEALITEGQLIGIYTVSQSDTAILRWLRLGKTYGNHVEVLSGLDFDETYIISAQGKLFNGAKILIQ